jgi:hypothetical protein
MYQGQEQEANTRAAKREGFINQPLPKEDNFPMVAFVILQCAFRNLVIRQFAKLNFKNFCL